jgi:hypothetical protein
VRGVHNGIEVCIRKNRTKAFRSSGWIFLHATLVKRTHMGCMWPSLYTQAMRLALTRIAPQIMTWQQYGEAAVNIAQKK